MTGATVDETLAKECAENYLALSVLAGRLAARGAPVDAHETALDELQTAAFALVGPGKAIDLAHQLGLDWSDA